jgi:hypothetical protein
LFHHRNPSEVVFLIREGFGSLDATCDGTICVTIASSVTVIFGAEGDQERLLRLGGDLLGGDRRGDLLLGDLRLRIGDLALMVCGGDLDLDGRGLPPPLSCVEEGVRLDVIACF